MITLGDLTRVNQRTDRRDSTAERADLLGRIDLEALFLELGMTQGRNRQWTCPVPTHAQTGATPPVSITNGNDYARWNCHGCHTGGTAVDLVKHRHGMDTAEAFAWLRERYGSPSAHTPPPRPKLHRPSGPPPDPDHGRLEGDRADQVLATYVESRQWSPDVVDVFGLYAVRGRFGAPRVRHPYRVGGEVRWWQDRAITANDNGSKWHNPTGIERMPYAADLRDTLARTSDRGQIVVVEGPPDVIAMWHALPNTPVIGLPGTEGVHRWAPMLAGLDVIIATDPDPAGDKAAEVLEPLVHATGGRTTRLRPPLDLDDWRRHLGDDDTFAEAICEHLDRLEWQDGADT